MNPCPNCGTLNKPGARFCQGCGKALTGGMQTIALGGMAQGRYQVQHLLGQGGMGAVYQVLDTRLGGKLLAMKEMSDAALTDPAEKAAAITAFRQEAELLGKLDHPNIPKVSDFFTEGGKHYIIMEFVQGETLEDRLARQGTPCSEQEVRAWARQLSEVLAYLHSQNPPVIFRDLKPSNIMITPQGQVKLIDFGIARLFKPGKTGDTQQMGTPGYAPPEQYGPGQQSDARSDIYSLGVVLHEALTRHDPASTPFRLPPVRQLNPAVSAELEQIIARATQPNMQQRYQSAAELLQALSAGQPRHNTPTVIVPPPNQTPPPPPRRQSQVSVWAVLAVVVLLLGGGVALAFQFMSKATPSPAPVEIVHTVVVSPTPAPAVDASATPDNASVPEGSAFEPTPIPPQPPTEEPPTQEPPRPPDTATPEPPPTRPTDAPTVDWRARGRPGRARRCDPLWRHQSRGADLPHPGSFARTPDRRSAGAPTSRRVWAQEYRPVLYLQQPQLRGARYPN